MSSDYVKNKRIALDSITSDLEYISIKIYTPPYDQFPNPNIYIDTNTIKLGTIQNGTEFVSFDSNQNILSVDLRVYTRIFNLSIQEAQENIKKLKTITIDDLIFYVDINYFQTEGLSKFKIKNIEIFVPTLAPTE